MTFTHAKSRDCDCDECGVALPAPIMAAIRERKRQRREDLPLRRTQDRTLVVRKEGITLWRVTMPVDAEPLVEFGSSHRLLWIKRLSNSCILRSIGKGIIGSSDEEKSRKVMNWAEGNMYLIKSNGGKAVGWTNNVRNDDPSTTEDKGHAILEVVKIPLNLPTTLNDSSWRSVFIKFCKKALLELEQDQKDRKNTNHYKFLSNDCETLKRAFEEAQEEATSSQGGVFLTATNTAPTIVEGL